MNREIKVSFPEAKLEALEFYLTQAGKRVENELTVYLDKLYEKNVHQQVRMYVEKKLDKSPSEQQPDQTPEQQPEGNAGHENGTSGNGVRVQEKRSNRRSRNNLSEEPAVTEPAEPEGEVQQPEQGMELTM